MRAALQKHYLIELTVIKGLVADLALDTKILLDRSHEYILRLFFLFYLMKSILGSLIISILIQLLLFLLSSERIFSLFFNPIQKFSTEVHVDHFEILGILFSLHLFSCLLPSFIQFPVFLLHLLASSFVILNKVYLIHNLTTGA